MSKFIFGVREEPLVALGDNVKECLEKIKKHYIDLEQESIDNYNNELYDLSFMDEPLSETDGFDSWALNTAVDESQEIIDAISNAKGIVGLTNSLKEHIDEAIEIVEEKFNDKK